MKPKINHLLFAIMILVVSLMFGITALAERQKTVFLPAVLSSQNDQSFETVAGYPISGLLAAIPLDNDTLLVIVLNDQNFVSYVFDAQGSQSMIDGWEVGGVPEQVEIVGCGWIVAQISPDLIQVHQSNLPFESNCK